MMDSSLLPQDGLVATGDGRPVCESEAGAYHLSKAYFRVQVSRLPDEKALQLEKLQVNYRPDRSKGYCLDYRPSPTAHDVVKVLKVKASRQRLESDAAIDDRELAISGSDLLHAITTDAIDESAFILKTLIRTIFVGISGNPNFNPELESVAARSLQGASVPNRVLDVEYDPFDLAQTALTNEALSELGFCIVVQGVTLREGTTIDSYCENPRRAAERNLHFARALMEAENPKATLSSRGVFYRPRVPFTVHLFLKTNRRAKGGWELRGSEVVELENISPILSIGLERAFFAQRKTTALFDRGELRNICVFKTSELVPFVEVPLEIAKSVVALPANIIQVRIDQSAGERNLLAAQDQLLRAEIDRLKAEKALTAAELGGSGESGARSSAAAAVGGLLEEQLKSAEMVALNQSLNDDFNSVCPAPAAHTAGMAFGATTGSE